jgi:hypothetical protein
VSYPAAYFQPANGALGYGRAVGASYGNGGRADFSNYGPNLSLVAPGAAAAVPRERWRVYLTDDDPPEAVAYCPACAASEFD